jgi:hypothetical protein
MVVLLVGSSCRPITSEVSWLEVKLNTAVPVKSIWADAYVNCEATSS